MVWIHHFSPRLYIKVGQTEILALDGKQSRERTALNLKSYTILVRYIWYSHLKDYRVDNSLRCKLVGSKVSIEVDEEEEEFYYIFSLLLLYIASKATKKNICNHIMTCLIFVCFSVRSVNSHQKRGILTQYVWSNIIKNYLMSEAIQSTNIKRVGKVVFKILFFYSDLLIQSLHSCLSPLRIVVH